MKTHLLVHETVQTSAMDCGPAALKSLFESFGIHISYGRLREACQTDVDGTSIDTLEQVANQLGLEAEQIMLPPDHVLFSPAHALPAIAVVRLPNALTHFILVWNHLGTFVQVMDPAVGRRLLTARSFLNSLYLHTFPVTAASWREWAGTDEFIQPLESRLEQLGIATTSRARCIEQALSKSEWYPLAALDAAIRMVNGIVSSGGLKRGNCTESVVETFWKQALEQGYANSGISTPYWFVRPAPPDDQGQEQLYLHGALLLRVRYKTTELKSAGQTDAADTAKSLSPELAATLAERPTTPGLELFKLLAADGIFTPLGVSISLILSAGVVVIEALLFWLLINSRLTTGLVAQNSNLYALTFAVVTLVLIIDWQSTSYLLRLGHKIETRLRWAFMYKIPRLGDRYFRSRLSSDMAERSHSIYRIHYFSEVAGKILFSIFEALFTTVGMLWVSPGHVLPILLAGFFAVSLPLFAFPLLAEQDLRVRVHVGALSRFYLDALLGLVTLRAHRAERAVRREQETVLREWQRAATGNLNVLVAFQAVQITLVLSCLAWLLVSVLSENVATTSILLLTYWGLRLPVVGREIMRYFQHYLSHRNLMLRLLEPLGAPESGDPVAAMGTTPKHAQSSSLPQGTAISMENVHVKAAGHTVLSGISLEIEPASQVAIIGPSGAGKSSLVALLLGWHQPAEGMVSVDGTPLDAAKLEQLRKETVWVDPAVQLWNKSLAENLRYGSKVEQTERLAWAIEQAELLSVIEQLPDGLNSSLGESGALVSGGEGQRVRLARGMLRSGVRLVILDEPFRGLAREQRRTLLAKARQLWQGATLICITHDVRETCDLDRVYVMEGGQIVEQGCPSALLEQPTSRFKAMLDAEQTVQQELWSGSFWRRWYMQQGHLQEMEHTIANE
ncbi:MAG: ATP-binding cassette domain-containing protein [Chloroflexi bacterium]|nr:ATP-binding cassette domain-containing protein [Chloroflexota bacterium]